MTKIKDSKGLSLLLILFVYLIALAVGLGVYFAIAGNILLRVGIADAVSTIIVWAAGVIFNNSSVYDAYWSVLPPFVFLLLAFEYGFSTLSLLLIIAVWTWGVRLTVNWIYTFKNLNFQDWRYDYFKKNNKKLWPLINFFGINFLPTVVVFFAMVPGIYIVTENLSANYFSYLGFIICLASVLLQLVSDLQMHSFREKESDAVLDTGLWQYSRHPNYLAEICMWWGIYLMLLSAQPSLWWTGIGAVFMTALFLLVSIPLMEDRQISRRPHYKSYQEKTSKLLLLPKKNN